MSVNIKSIAYGGGVYIAVNGDQILKSTDGNNWTVVMERDQTSNNNYLTKVLYGGGKFLKAGQSFVTLLSVGFHRRQLLWERSETTHAVYS